MKKFKFSMLAMAGLLFAGCADKEVVEGGGGQNEIPSEGYVSLAINLPTTSSTRAANDNFDDGVEKEYKVNSCLLLIFEGTSESDANLIHADDVDKDNITTSYRVVSKISGYDNTEGSSKNLYALAALNYEGVITYDGDDVKIGTKLVNTLSDLNSTTTDVNLIDVGPTGGKGFFMTNAVLSNIPGGATSPTNADITQLAKLDKSKICSTKDEARQKPAGEILVERAVAKATLKLANSVKVGFGTNITISSSDVSWTLDNLEPETYVARNKGTNDYITYKSGKVSLTHPYRFVSHTSTKIATSLGTSEDFYRTYWCVDPNYDKSGTMKRSYENPMNLGTGTAHKYTSVGDNNPLYCFENTFDVPHQRYKNTTRAIIKVKINGGQDFYTFNEEKVLYTEENVKSKAMAEAIERMKNVITSSDVKSGTFEYGSVKFECTLSVNSSDNSCTVNTLSILNADEIFNGDMFNNPSDVKTKAEKAVKEALEYVQANYYIYKYTDGEMYYEARFTHFGKDLTPWNDNEYTNDDYKPTAGDVGKAYPGCKSENNDDQIRAANNYLGRYGMVRNNWYDVEIEAFNNFGSPVEPGGEISSDETPDDSLDEYIAVKVHVLAWAKRTQSWGF